MSDNEGVDIITTAPQTDDPVLIAWLEKRREALLMELRFIEEALGMERTKTAREIKREAKTEPVA